MAINVAMVLPIIIILALVIIGVIIFAYNKRLDKVVKGEVHDIHSNIPEPKTAISTTYQAVLMILVVILVLNLFSMGNKINSLENELNNMKSEAAMSMGELERKVDELVSANEAASIYGYEIYEYDEKGDTAKIRLEVKMNEFTEGAEVLVVLKGKRGDTEVKCELANSGLFVGTSSIDVFDDINGAVIKIKNNGTTKIVEDNDFFVEPFCDYYKLVMASGSAGTSTSLFSDKSDFHAEYVYSVENIERIKSVTAVLFVDDVEYERKDITQQVIDGTKVKFEVKGFNKNVVKQLEVEYINGYKSVERSMVQDFENAGDGYNLKIYDANGNIKYELGD